MTQGEQEIAGDEIVMSAKKKAFAHDLPITYEKDGFVIWEYAGGRIVRLKSVEHKSSSHA